MTITVTSQRLDGSKFCSYRVGGPIDDARMPTTIEEGQALLDSLSPDDPVTILGGGCNTLIASNGIRGVTLISKRLTTIEKLDDTRILFGGGVSLAKAADTAQQFGLTGAEYMIGIPGTIGGAISMNAGATGQSTHEIIESAYVYNRPNQALETWSLEDLDFSYRHSAIHPKQHIVLGGVIKLQPGDPEAIAGKMKKNIAWRNNHHPKEPNGGSVFKNPSPEDPAGKLLDQLGAKGWQEGGAMVSPKHANFIVNVDNARSIDVLRLMWRMKEAIESTTNYIVSPENRFVGDATEEERQLWVRLNGYEL